MTRSAIELALEMARHTVACVDQTVADLRPHYENKNETIIARALLALAEQNAAMVASLGQIVESIEHAINVTERHREQRDRGGQHVGTGGELGNVPPSGLSAMRRYVRTLKFALSPPATEREK